MNSMIVLNELRATKVKRLQEKIQCAEVKNQLEKIDNLQRKKAALTLRLHKLSQEIFIEDQVHSLRDLKGVLYNLEEKLCSYRLIGPCGLTVAEVDTNCLVVTFTSMWKNITESYILKIVAVDGQVKVSGTSIPYFIDIQALMERSKSSAWHQRMDDIGHILSAYVQRKGELDSVMQEYKEFIKSSSPDESLTSIEIILYQTDVATGSEKQICIYLVYPDISSILPEKAVITTDKMYIAKQTVSGIERKFLTSPFSGVMPAVVNALKSGKHLSDGEEDDDDNN